MGASANLTWTEKAGIGHTDVTDKLRQRPDETSKSGSAALARGNNN